MEFFQVIIGLIILVVAAEFLVRGSVAFANNFSVPTVIIGLTIVSFGTSAPELVISLQSALSDHSDIALGNIVGSNIANILMVIGISALVFPIAVHKKLIKKDAPFLLVVTVLLIIFCLNGEFSRIEGGAFLVITAGYLFFIFRDVKNGEDAETMEEIKEETNIHMSNLKAVIFIIGGIVALVFGSRILIDGAVILAQNLGVSEVVIGLTVLAVGSSAPELVTSVVAAYHKHSDIALANIIGSNLFNIMAVGGITAAISSISVDIKFLNFDFYILAIVTIILFLFMLTGRKLSRFEGGIFLAGYIGYGVWQYLG